MNRSALQNAAFVAAMFLTTEAVVAKFREFATTAFAGWKIVKIMRSMRKASLQKRLQRT